MVMSGQVLESWTTGLRSFSAVIRRSAALSRSACDNTMDAPSNARGQYRRGDPRGASTLSCLVAGTGQRKARGMLARTRTGVRPVKLPVYEVLAQAFIAEGVDTVFTLMGDANMHWANAMAKHNGVRLVHTRHEHCACTAAISYAWATGKPGVASVTCGPGFTQTMTALATASRGHVPLVVMAGETSIGAAYHNQRIEQAPFAVAAGAH